jgi:uncharacterized protein YjbI with pentapeptide repeats
MIPTNKPKTLYGWIRRSWSRMMKRINSSQASIDAIWIILFLGTIQLIRVGLPVTKIILLAGLCVFVLRFAPRIPGLRWFWVGLFGERTFWDWMTLLCAPILLSSIGVVISTSINNQQSDVSITKERLDLANEYYNRMSELILTPEFQQLAKRKRAESMQKPVPSNDEENCNPDPDNPLSSIAYSRTASALRTLKHLKTSTESYTPMQQSIIQLLHYSGLIQRRGHVVSLQQAQFSGSSLSDIDLSDSCFDSVDFGDTYMKRVVLRNSNLKASNFRGANLTKADLKDVNLSAGSSLKEVNAVGALFNGADLREVVFDNAILREAKFRRRYPERESIRTNLQGARFVNADLRNAIFTDADLRNANFEGADLRGADLRGVRINAGTKWQGAKFNTIRLDNSSATKRREAVLNFMQKLWLDKVFEIKGWAGTSFNLGPTQHDATFNPLKLGMKQDHSL